MQTISLSKNLKVSKLIHGHWRLLEWNLSNKELLKLTQQIIDLGITTFDHADIYGDYQCEKKFGNALNLDKSIRNKIQIITKCGIKLISENRPSHSIKNYDYSFEHIIKSVDQSLKNFNTDYIDALLLHRPAPFFDPNEIAKAFSELQQKGKVLNFGVSNFNPIQFEMLQEYLDMKLVTNQIEISPYYLEHFENGNIDFLLKNGITPMSWSPLAGGNIFNPKNDRLLSCLSEISNEHYGSSIDQIIYAWILKHPANIIPVIGTGKLERIKTAIDSFNIELTLEQWYRIYNASTGNELP